MESDRHRAHCALASAATTLAAVVLCALLMTLTAACGAGQPVGQASPTPEPLASGSPRLELTQQERDAVLAVVESDAALASLRKRVSWRPAGDWSILTAQGSDAVIGGGVTLRWREPVSIDMQWPASIYDPKGQGDPQDYLVHAAGDRLTAIYVLIDLERGQVVRVFPANPEAQITTSLPADFEPLYPLPEED